MALNEHDKAIGGVARQWKRQGGFAVYTNPNQEHNKEYNGEWPDVVVEMSGHTIIAAVCEVEAEDSVTDEEAKQWAKYASGDAYFYLYVPIGKCAEAKALLEKHSIECEGLYEYSVALGFLASEC